MKKNLLSISNVYVFECIICINNFELVRVFGYMKFLDF